MTLKTINKLVKGDKSIQESYNKVGLKWTELLKDFDWGNGAIDRIKEMVYDNQIKMEVLVGEEILGQEIMVIVGMGQFNDDNGVSKVQSTKMKIVYQGIMKSLCSSTVKSYAEFYAKQYRILD